MSESEISVASTESLSTGSSSTVGSSSSEEAKSVKKVRKPEVQKTENESYNAKVHIVNPQGNLHLGTQLTINGPVYIRGLTKQDIITVNDNCQCKKKIYVPKLEKIENETTINKFKRQFFERISVKKSIILGIVVTMIYILILYYLKNHNQKNLGEPKCKEINLTTVLSEIRSGLLTLVPRQEWENPVKEYYRDRYNISSDHNCTYDCCTKFKSKIRFIMVKDIWASCDNYKPVAKCELQLLGEFLRTLYYNASTVPFFDIYYNYIIGYNGKIYEGRSLTCPFDERNLNEDHSEIITIGIPYCFGRHYGKPNAENEWLILTSSLLDVLGKTGVLRHSFDVEFPKLCEYLFEVLNRKTEIRNVLSHSNDFYNITSKFNKTCKDNLLFLPDYENASNSTTISIERLDLNYLSSLEYDCLSKTDTSLYNFTKLEVQIIQTNGEYPIIPPDNLTCENSHNCHIVLDRLIRESNELNSIIINYVIVFPDLLYKVVPSNCSVIYEKNIRYADKVVLPVNILILYSKMNNNPIIPRLQNFMEVDDIVEKFSQLTRQIANDIRRDINYTQLTQDISFMCVSLDGANTVVKDIYSIITKAYEMWTSVEYERGFNYNNELYTYSCYG